MIWQKTERGKPSACHLARNILSRNWRRRKQKYFICLVVQCVYIYFKGALLPQSAVGVNVGGRGDVCGEIVKENIK